MSLSNPSPPTQQHDEDPPYTGSEPQRIIRQSGTSTRQGGKWGFPIVRCTYTSASRWEKYLSLIHEDVYKFLAHPRDRDLRESFDCPIIEDAARLEGATWQEARSKYDAWAWDRMREQLDAPLGEDDVYSESDLKEVKDLFVAQDEKLKLARERGEDVAIPKMNVDQLAILMPLVEPRWTFFIFADKASVDSVVDHAGPEERKGLGAYYFTIVLSNLHIREGGISKDLFLVDDDSEEFLREVRQKFKAYELVELFAGVVHEEWTYGYHCPVGEDGICEIW